MKYSKLLSFLVPIITIGLLEFFYFLPKTIFLVLFLLFLFYVFVIWFFCRENNSKIVWFYLVLPVCFTYSLIAFTILINVKYVQIFFILNTVFIYLYYRSIYLLMFDRKNYPNNSLENFSAFGNFIAFYFTCSTIYGFQSFLDIEIWILMIILTLFIILIVCQVMYTNKIQVRKWAIFVPVLCLVLIELAWSFSFLTLSHYILGLILAIYYYILIGLTRFYLLAKLDKRIIKLYVYFGMLSMLIVLFTARWI